MNHKTVFTICTLKAQNLNYTNFINNKYNLYWIHFANHNYSSYCLYFIKFTCASCYSISLEQTERVQRNNIMMWGEFQASPTKQSSKFFFPFYLSETRKRLDRDCNSLRKSQRFSREEWHIFFWWLQKMESRKTILIQNKHL